MNIKKDFNSMFWGIIGVNNRVFEVEDIFQKKRDNKQMKRDMTIF